MKAEFGDRDVLFCESIAYRSGAIEVLSNIHQGCVNLETWNVFPDTNSEKQSGYHVSLEGELQANVELELDKKTALELIARLQAAVAELD